MSEREQAVSPRKGKEGDDLNFSDSNGASASHSSDEDSSHPHETTSLVIYKEKKTARSKKEERRKKKGNRDRKKSSSSSRKRESRSGDDDYNERKRKRRKKHHREREASKYSRRRNAYGDDEEKNRELKQRAQDEQSESTKDKAPWIPKRASGRSFASVIRTLGKAGTEKVTDSATGSLLAITDGKEQDDGTNLMLPHNNDHDDVERNNNSVTSRSTTVKDLDFGEIDFVKEMQKALSDVESNKQIDLSRVNYIYNIDDDSYGECSERKGERSRSRLDAVTDRQRQLNKRTRECPTDIQAWIDLAALSHTFNSVISNQDADSAGGGGNDSTMMLHQQLSKQERKERQKRDADLSSELQRSRDILRRAISLNPSSVSLHCAHLACLEKIQTLSSLSTSTITVDREVMLQVECNASIKYFEHLVGMKSVMSKLDREGNGNIPPLPSSSSPPPTTPPPPPQSFMPQVGAGRGRGVSNLPAWMSNTNTLDEFGRLISNNPTVEESPRSEVPNDRHNISDAENDAITGKQVSLSLLHLYRIKLQWLPRSKGAKLSVRVLRDAYRQGFQSIVKAYDMDNKEDEKQLVGEAPCFLLLDYLQVEVMMGYSERALAVVQAALELAFRPVEDTDFTQSESSSLQTFWESGFPRIGDCFPGAGFREWRERKTQEHYSSMKCENTRQQIKPPATVGNGLASKVEDTQLLKATSTDVLVSKRNKRVRASDLFELDFLGDDVCRKGFVQTPTEVDPVETTSQTPLSGTGTNQSRKDNAEIEPRSVENSKIQSEENDTLRTSRLVPNETQCDSKQTHPNLHVASTTMETDTKEGKFTAHRTVRPTSKVVEDLVEQGEVVPSLLQSDSKGSSGTIEVYSFVHKRRIQIAKEDLTEDSTKTTLRNVLHKLLRRKKQHSDASGGGKLPKIKVRGDLNGLLPAGGKTSIHAVAENDPFLTWAIGEQVQDQGIISPPAVNKIVYEDGIQDIVVPFFSRLDPSCALPLLIASCFRFLGVWFPRSSTFYDLNKTSFGCATDRLEIKDSALSAEQLIKQSFSESSAGNTCQNNRMEETSWAHIYNSVCRDVGVVRIQSSIFSKNGEKHLAFLKNTMYTIAAEAKKRGCDSAPWSVFCQVALLYIEGETGKGTPEKTRAIGRSILQGSEAARHDPRLWLAYAQLEERLSSAVDGAKDKDMPTTKILLSALTATGESGLTVRNEAGWIELSLATFRSLMKLPLDSPIVIGELAEMAQLEACSRAKEKALHVLCCAAEGKFSRKREKKSKRVADKIDDASLATRILSCRKLLLEKLETFCAENRTSSMNACTFDQMDLFDPSPPLAFFGSIAAWLDVLSPFGTNQKANPDFALGLKTLDFWIDRLHVVIQIMKLHRQQTHASRTCIKRWANLKVEFGLLRYKAVNQSASDAPLLAFNLMKNVLMPTTVKLKLLEQLPSNPILAAITYCEAILSRYDPEIRGYFHLAHTNDTEELWAFLARTILVANQRQTEVVGSDKAGGAKCLNWTAQDCVKVQTILHHLLRSPNIISNDLLWSTLINLELLGGTGEEKQLSQTKRFNRASRFFVKALDQCPHSKKMWLLPFTALRPLFNEEQMFSLLARMEQAEIGLVRGLDQMKFN